MRALLLSRRIERKYPRLSMVGGRSSYEIPREHNLEGDTLARSRDLAIAALVRITKSPTTKE